MVFTARICCVSAITASKVMAFVALIMTGWVAWQAWFTGLNIIVNIFESIMLVILLLACGLVFIACSRRNPQLMIPIIIIQLINFLSILGNAIYDLIWDAKNLHTVWDWCYAAGMYGLAIIVSAFILHCHVCCYKLLILKSHRPQHHGGV